MMQVKRIEIGGWTKLANTSIGLFFSSVAYEGVNQSEMFGRDVIHLFIERQRRKLQIRIKLEKQSTEGVSEVVGSASTSCREEMQAKSRKGVTT